MIPMLGEHEGVPFIAMEYVDGELLARGLQRAPLRMACHALTAGGEA